MSRRSRRKFNPIRVFPLTHTNEGPRPTDITEGENNYLVRVSVRGNNPLTLPSGTPPSIFPHPHAPVEPYLSHGNLNPPLFFLASGFFGSGFLGSAEALPPCPSSTHIAASSFSLMTIFFPFPSRKLREVDVATVAARGMTVPAWKAVAVVAERRRITADVFMLLWLIFCDQVITFNVPITTSHLCLGKIDMTLMIPGNVKDLWKDGRTLKSTYLNKAEHRRTYSPSRSFHLWIDVPDVLVKSLRTSRGSVVSEKSVVVLNHTKKKYYLFLIISSTTNCHNVFSNDEWHEYHITTNSSKTIHHDAFQLLR